MKCAALFSGGKDSTYAIHIVQQMDWEVEELLALIPQRPDSFMFHVPNIGLTPILAQALGIPLTQQYTSGEEEKELEDLRCGLQLIDAAVAVDHPFFSQAEHILRAGIRLGNPEHA